MAATRRLTPITIQSGQTVRIGSLSAVDTGSLEAFLARKPFYGVDGTSVLEPLEDGAAERLARRVKIVRGIAGTFLTAFVLVTIFLGSVHVGRFWAP